MDINYLLSFLSPWDCEFSLGSSHIPFPLPSPFGTYLICSVRPEPSIVLAPHRCSFSEMSFCKRQHSVIRDGKRCATVWETMQLTHMTSMSPASTASFSQVLLCTHPSPHVKLSWWALKPLSYCIPHTFPFRSPMTSQSSKLQMSSPNPSS